jgi:hypothetical protein
MKRYRNLEEYSTDDLIIIVYAESEHWQKKAVDYAKYLLEKRGITVDSAKSRLIEIEKQIDLFWQGELKKRNIESYDAISLISMTLFWFKHILWDWYLAREGYLKKRKQRLYAISIGVLFYIIMIGYGLLTSEEQENQRLIEIEALAIADSIQKASVDWTGLYSFIDTSITSRSQQKITWCLDMKKDWPHHKGLLTLTDNFNRYSISCTGVINGFDIEIYPDTTYQLFEDIQISYYDKLFTLSKQDEFIMTYWWKLKPLFYPSHNDIGLFREKTACNN